jgi:hypothetical protein
MLEIRLHTCQPVFRRGPFCKLQTNIAHNITRRCWKRKVQRGGRQQVGHTADLSAEVAARFLISDLLAIQAPADKRVTIAANLPLRVFEIVAKKGVSMCKSFTWSEAFVPVSHVWFGSNRQNNSALSEQERSRSRPAETRNPLFPWSPAKEHQNQTLTKTASSKRQGTW